MELDVGDSKGVQVVKPQTSKDIHRKQLPIVAYGLMERTSARTRTRGTDVKALRDEPQPFEGVASSATNVCHFTRLSAAEVSSQTGRLALLDDSFRIQALEYRQLFCYDFAI